MRGDEAAMIFQDASASLDPTWSVGDQIAEDPPRASARQPARREGARHRPHDRGWHRRPRARATTTRRIASRAACASASSSPPRSPTTLQLLIADEPTTALDVTIQAQVLQLIDKLRREHGTTVHAHHPRPRRGLAGLRSRRRHVRRQPARSGRDARSVRSPRRTPTRAPCLPPTLPAAPRGARLPVIPAEWSVESLEAAERLCGASAWEAARP